jgi:hypothetical protein
MRKPTYLSHSSNALYYSNSEEFYVRHLSEHRLPRSAQQDFMSIGSGFDAREKSCLHAALFGPGSDPQFEFEAIFESQVEPHNRDWCREESKYVFDCYHKSGAHDDLLELLKQSESAPRFEFTVQGHIAGVPFLGKPDCRFIHRNGFPVILDWKVRGFCSKYAQSPTKFYRLCRNGFDGATSKRSNHNQAHPLYMAYDFKGFEIHAGYMEDGDSDYADQLAAYSWLMGEPIGSEFVGCIDELVCKPSSTPGGRPTIRVANHRARVRPEYQQDLLRRITGCWEAIESGHIFKHLTKEENDERCRTLDQIAISLNSGDDNDFFNEITKSAYR